MRLLLATALLMSFAPARADGGRAGLSSLRVHGIQLVDDNGDPVILRGVNFGNWLVLEPFFLGVRFSDEASLWAGLESRFGRDGMERVREAYRSAWITPADFDRVRALGLNSVRIPFWYAMLESDSDPGRYSPTGWKWLDMAVDNCERARIYCVLDFHGVPGGQSTADHTGAADRNQFWTHPKDQDRAAAIWTAVAQRYRGRSAIAAFDLINEPMGAPNFGAIVSASDRLFHAVHGADPDRLVIVEDGYRGLDGFPPPSKLGWSNVIYSQHHYPTMGETDPLPSIHERYFREDFPKSRRQQERLGAPVYVGEWNVIHTSAGGGPMTARYVREMEAMDWSWAIWVYKQTASEAPSDLWSFYRNDRPLALPDFDHATLEEILARIDGLRTENMALYGQLADAVKPKPVSTGTALDGAGLERLSRLCVPAELLPDRTATSCPGP